MTETDVATKIAQIKRTARKAVRRLESDRKVEQATAGIMRALADPNMQGMTYSKFRQIARFSSRAWPDILRNLVRLGVEVYSEPSSRDWFYRLPRSPEQKFAETVTQRANKVVALLRQFPDMTATSSKLCRMAGIQSAMWICVVNLLHDRGDVVQYDSGKHVCFRVKDHHGQAN